MTALARIGLYLGLTPHPAGRPRKRGPSRYGGPVVSRRLDEDIDELRGRLDALEARLDARE